jgi:cell division control protein 6
MLDIIESEPSQFQLVLYSIMELDKEKGSRQKKLDGDSAIFTGDVYSMYESICLKTKNEVLTQRRVSDIVGEFDMLGLINARVISKGRQGRTREIKLGLGEGIKGKAREILETSLGI